MDIFTIGFTHKTAQTFFSLLLMNHIETVVDIRLHNTSQLDGFSKQVDLEYFLKALGGIGYIYYPEFAPTEAMLKSYRSKEITQQQWLTAMQKLIRERDPFDDFHIKVKHLHNICLLCSEEKPDYCHRRIVAEYLHDRMKGSRIIDL